MPKILFPLFMLFFLALSGCAVLQGPAELPPSAIKTQDGTIVTLEDVLFEFDEAILRPQGWEMVSAIGRYMQRYPEIKAHIAGHTDNIGDAAYNLELSRRRAEAVRNILRARGVAAARISVRNYGAERPVADNSSADGRRKNRRVELTLSPLPATPR
jgi:outer membrane protein OmpA-like peptidoglycan-associated protein